MDEVLVQGSAVGKPKSQYPCLKVVKLLCINHIARLTVSAQDTVTDMFYYLLYFFTILSITCSLFQRYNSR